MFTVTGQIVDVVSGKIIPGKISIDAGIISDITFLSNAPDRLICPGLVDAHVHIESSLLVPSEFARVAVTHGTIGSVSDPHEIANVLGVRGVQFMISNGAQTPFYFCWGAPSCVPATDFETAGGAISVQDIRYLFSLPEVGYLAEMMNYPGVIMRSPEVMAKIAVARELSKPIDGHAPMLRGDDLTKYIKEGISTDHETMTLEEAREKIEKGMKILIREGSAARNFQDLLPILFEHPERCMFCTDDAHPSFLIAGHINKQIRRAIAAGVPLLTAIRVATLNPVRHYKLKMGLLQKGDYADFIVIPSSSTMEVESTYIKGQQVASDGKSKLPRSPVRPINNFSRESVSERDLHVRAEEGDLRVIRVIDGQLFTESEIIVPRIEDGLVVADPDHDVLKLVVLNRYEKRAKPAVAFVKGFGMKRGAIASSVGHDSHNIIALGTNDQDLERALNLVVKNQGGLVLVEGTESIVLSLPIAGLMSTESVENVAKIESELHVAARELGAKIEAPFTMLSFLSLLVIPKLKLSDRGLFDGEVFKFVSQFVV